MSPKKLRSMTGLLSIIEVCTEQGIIIGKGHIVHYEGRILGPYLGTLTGGEMPAGWYSMVITDDPILVIMNESIQ